MFHVTFDGISLILTVKKNLWPIFKIALSRLENLDISFTGAFRTLSNICNGAFCKIKAVNYFLKTLILDVRQGSE